VGGPCTQWAQRIRQQSDSVRLWPIDLQADSVFDPNQRAEELRSTCYTYNTANCEHRSASHRSLQCIPNSPIAVVDELDIRIYVCPASSASRNDRVSHNRNWLLALLDGSVGGDHEAQWNLRLIQQRRRGRNGVHGAPLV
jgi:hypothetical protein